MTIHRNLQQGAWHKLSLAEQMGNVGSEVNRSLRPKGRDAAIERALELLDLTLRDPRWKNRRKEIARAREVLCDAAFGNSEYNTSLEDLNKYFFDFALLARKNR